MPAAFWLIVGGFVAAGAARIGWLEYQHRQRDNEVAKRAWPEPSFGRVARYTETRGKEPKMVIEGAPDFEFVDECPQCHSSRIAPTAEGGRCLACNTWWRP